MPDNRQTDRRYKSVFSLYHLFIYSVIQYKTAGGGDFLRGFYALWNAPFPGGFFASLNRIRRRGIYYTVSYKNNRKAGKATATVKFKGGYSGTVKKTFTIRPAGTFIRKLTAVSGGFAVKWKKKTVQTGGYQIQYSANAGFQGSSTHSVFVKKNTAVKKTVKNLKAGKKYYVRIRTYQTVKEDGKNIRIYSAWSRAARVATLPVSRKKTASSSRDRAFLMVEKEDGKNRAA